MNLGIQAQPSVIDRATVDAMPGIPSMTRGRGYDWRGQPRALVLVFRLWAPGTDPLVQYADCSKGLPSPDGVLVLANSLWEC